MLIALALGAGLTVISAAAGQAPGASWACAYAAERLPRTLGLLGDDVASAEETRAARRRLSLPAGDLTRASSLVLAREMGAIRLVTIRCEDNAGQTTIEARAFDPDQPVGGNTIRVVKPRADIAAAIDELGSRLATASTPLPFTFRAPSAEALGKAGPALAASSPNERARGLIQALALDETSIDLRLSAVEALIAARDFEQAIRVGSTPLPAEAPDPLVRALRYLAGAAQLEAGRYAEASETFERLRQARETAAVLNNLGIARFRLRDPSASDFFARAFSRSDPRQDDIAFNQALALIFEGKSDQALGSLGLTIERNPGDARSRLLRVWALRILQREPERAEEWERLVSMAPSFASLGQPDLARRLERIFFFERKAGG